MGVVKKLTALWKSKRDPIKYAREIGVKVGENCKFFSTDFGSEPWLVEIGNHVEISGGVGSLLMTERRG